MEKRLVILAEEIDQDPSLFPVLEIYKNDFIERQALLYEQDVRECSCVPNALLNMMICTGLTNGKKPSDLLNDIKRAVPEVQPGATHPQDFLNFLKSEEYFKDQVLFLSNSQSLQNLLVVFDYTERVLISYGVKDARHTAFLQFKDHGFFLDGLKVPLSLIVGILAQEKTFTIALIDKNKISDQE